MARTLDLHTDGNGAADDFIRYGSFWHLTDVTSRAADVGSSRYSRHHASAGSHPTPACSATSVTLAPTDDRPLSRARGAPVAWRHLHGVGLRRDGRRIGGASWRSAALSSLKAVSMLVQSTAAAGCAGAGADYLCTCVSYVENGLSPSFNLFLVWTYFGRRVHKKAPQKRGAYS